MTDCAEIRNLLSEYLDNALDAKAKALADEHLHTCPACREELDSLRALVKELGSIESVKAPADFLDQLHKRMERPSKRSTVREWLFYPLRVKIPLQLAGAAVVALIIFSILPLQQPSVRQYSKSEQETKAGGRAYDMDESKGTKPAGRSDAPVKSAAPREIAQERDAGKPTASSEPLVRKAATPAPVKDKKTWEMTLNLKKHFLPKAATAEPSAAQAPASPAVHDMQRQKLAAGTPVQEDKKEEKMKKEIDPVLSITKAVEAAKGTVLAVDHHPHSGRPGFVQAEIPAGQLPILYEKLRELGELQAPPVTLNEKNSDLVPIKIRLIGLQ
jgi:hypothetical protein